MSSTPSWFFRLLWTLDLSASTIPWVDLLNREENSVEGKGNKGRRERERDLVEAQVYHSLSTQPDSQPFMILPVKYIGFIINYPTLGNFSYFSQTIWPETIQGKKILFWLPHLGDTFYHGREKTWAQEWEADGHNVSSGRKQRVNKN